MPSPIAPRRLSIILAHEAPVGLVSAPYRRVVYKKNKPGTRLFPVMPIYSYRRSMTKNGAYQIAGVGAPLAKPAWSVFGEGTIKTPGKTGTPAPIWLRDMVKRKYEYNR